MPWNPVKMPFAGIPVLLAAAFLVAACQDAPQADTGAPEAAASLASSGQTPAHGTRGMVSSAHPLATEVGLRILEDGGNAFDAAVAVAAALNVVEPMMSGMGGYGTILVYSAAEGRARFLNPSGRIPRGVDPDAYRAPTPDFQENRRGAKAVSTPGNANAWAAMSREYGELPWGALLEPAARLAEEGFEVDARTARLIGSAFDEFPQHAREFYGVDGRPLEEGERLIQADLASTLRLVGSEGPGAFHGGAIGAAIDQAMVAAGGFLRLSDLAENEAEWWEPIEIDYRGHLVLVPPPPANSFPALVRMGMMSQVDVTEMGHNSPDFLHFFAEVTKHGFWTRLRYAGDPEIAPPPLDLLLSREYWAQEVARIDPEQATRFVPPGTVGESGANTTHFVVADEDGNVVSATQTLGNSFGSRIMPEGTGVWLNNSLAYCTFEPAGNPMDAHPGRRKLSGDVPLFVMADGKPWIALGTPGGHTIGQTVPQVVMNVLDFGMDIQAAIAAPRVTFVEPDFLAVEEAIPEAVFAELEARGHQVRRTGGIGNVHGLTIRWGADGVPTAFTGGADPRGSGLAKGR
jgi:gamma-glutamyltranspeptidase/glutathione hydrolase